jgi:hypothetical protein
LDDVLTWLPPTPPLLTDATLLLFRFTLNGTISSRNIRNTVDRREPLHLSLGQCCVVISLFTGETGGDEIGNCRLALGLSMMGESLQLGNPETEAEKSTVIREVIADRDPNFLLPSTESTHVWREMVEHFAAALHGYDEEAGLIDSRRVAKRRLRFDAWDFEARPVLEHAVVYAACKSGDTDSLSLARSICSQGVTLRPNAPKEWWRYSIVLGLLGDEVGSEDALNNSINFGGGQGARR